ncbi:MAG: 2-dehydropantoate 2-reductase [Bacteroidetes bacterium GWF2_38_335]|nr:MAG: 2-dehydropantoate 2-reductase [Bacteroidetes bacterium GWF2_38_335]OFY79789.1 MAG: 2-dehydropantoate 2-reductase [Bacteroidetes bacterium RIFOXYA12_FULL_38_20]HBS88177.1 2-dehydropantoate 2-reductase [Bacteroidales bacterium]
MKIAIIGAGGVGGYFGARMAKAGFDVTFLARGEHLKAIKKNGLTVKSISGDFHLNNVKATDNIQDLKEIDLVILAVKAWQIKEIRDDIKTIIHSNSTIIPLQNGVLATEELMESIDKSNILGGLCRIISKIEAPGVINHFGVTPAIVFGELNKSDSERTRNLKTIFDKAEIGSKISNDIESEIWKKFIAICVSGLLAVTKTTYGELRELRETRQMMIDLLNEIYLISQKAGVAIESGFVEKSVSFIETFPYDSTSSLTRDVWEGRPSEIDYQNGTVIKLGEKYGVETPVNRFIYNCILPSELKARGLKK